jgi:hypothetical protein
MLQDEIHSLYRKGKLFSRRFEKGTKKWILRLELRITKVK